MRPLLLVSAAGKPNTGPNAETGISDVTPFLFCFWWQLLNLADDAVSQAVLTGHIQ
ncbi:hypothetical protein [Phyllobacterium myrsinacearum]|uniref:hypothetical protein n=1 Tax=Phyllobacterium myrsinacearum TaxID=28101 RepID=UPI0013EE92C8|nr:hypothetical protein [Phyllobacterium myrsinacearum]